MKTEDTSYKSLLVAADHATVDAGVHPQGRRVISGAASALRAAMQAERDLPRLRPLIAAEKKASEAAIEARGRGRTIARIEGAWSDASQALADARTAHAEHAARLGRLAAELRKQVEVWAGGAS